MKKLNTIFTKGGHISSITKDDAKVEAEKHGLTFFYIDCDKGRSLSAVLRAFVKGVDYPVFFGSDMDSFFDCLSETVLDQAKGACLFIDNLHTEDPALIEGSKEIVNVLEAVVEAMSEEKKVLVYHVVNVGKHGDPEPIPQTIKYTDTVYPDVRLVEE
ncbi:barstar family protein [Basilea psittacipulmonis]|uniref:barstar family protein n=1 Tax=Basilea psittacipulmonis TaxID=1472345 RepID=UPI000691A5F1|nr:barstar family protein [Basilea psittacipulmonis]